MKTSTLQVFKAKPKESKVIPKRRLAAGLQDLLPAVVAFVLIAIVGSVGALILQGFSTSSSVTANSIAYNATQYGLKGINTFMSYLPLIALVIVAAILIGIVLVAFAFGGNRGGERF
jgi:flagellar biosynthesis protein FlhB